VALTYPGLLNFRDVGGLPVSGGGYVRRGALYRSACPREFEPGALAAHASLGLRTIVDLRDESELVTWPYELDDPSVRRLNIAVLDDGPVPPDQGGFYAHMVERCGESFVAAVRVVAQALPDPVLVHCAVGKDRTGLTVALVLAAVGVPDEAVVADYVLSNAGLGLAEPEPGVDPERDENGNYLTGRYVAPELIADSLARARALGGGIHGFLKSRGMTDGELARLRATLIGPADAAE
jgi:protein-tyrosine phosphatase